MKKVSLSKIASMLNISTVTVHKALKNQQGVSEKLRAQIIALASELGYEPPKQNTQSYSFIFLIHKNFILSPNEQFYSEIYHRLNIECMLSDSKLHLVVHDELKTTISNIKLIMNEHKIDGIFVSGEMAADVLEHINNLLPVTCIDFYSSEYSFDYIYVDNYYASYLLTKYLIKKGHRKIGFIGNVQFSSAIADRYFGYRRALNKYMIPFLDTLHINRNIETENFVLPKDFPTAYICHCDRAASILYPRIRDAGLKIPQDISVISFDNTSLCEHLSPKLTSFGIEKSVFASVALKTMLSRVNKQKTVYNHTKLNLDIYERESVRDIII